MKPCLLLLVYEALPPLLQNATIKLQGVDVRVSPPLLPSPPASYNQRAWDKPRVTAAADVSLRVATDDRTPGSSWLQEQWHQAPWLQAHCMLALGLPMQNDIIRVAGMSYTLPTAQLSALDKDHGRVWATWPQL